MESAPFAQSGAAATLQALVADVADIEA